MEVKALGSWVVVVGACFVSALYLNWVCYSQAAQQDGSFTSVLGLAMKWYGIPAVVVIQLLIWWVMPRLFAVTPSPWIAALVWPFASAISNVIVLWPIKHPAKGDWIAIVGMFIPIVVAWIWRD